MPIYLPEDGLGALIMYFKSKVLASFSTMPARKKIFGKRDRDRQTERERERERERKRELLSPSPVPSSSTAHILFAGPSLLIPWLQN